MKPKFSTSWKASKQPRKQRKYRYNAPLHVKRKFLAATLDKPLREKHKRRSIEVRKGDEIKIMRGKMKGKSGKVSLVETKRTRISVDGIQTTKKDGTKINLWFHPSNVKIMNLNLDDIRRMKKANVEKEKEEKKTENKSGEKQDAHKKK